MIKVIRSTAWDYGMNAARLVDVHSKGVDGAWMQKRAAALTREIDNIRPEPGHSFIHLISLGAMEAYGQNRNGDAFNEKAGSFKVPFPEKGCPDIVQMGGGLIEYHPTFSKHAHVFKHHVNKDPAGAIGEIKASAYNPDMHRGELLIKVANDHPDWKNELEKLANGQDIPFSMATKVPNDMCLLCGHRSRTRADYCKHASLQMSDILKSGHQVGVLNDVNDYFDISKVFRPADRIAWSLQKVASLTNIGGAELAEQLGLSATPVILGQGGPANFSRKMAAARKLAAIEKLIEGVAQGEDNRHLDHTACGCPSSDLPDAAMKTLQGGDLESVLHSISDAKICLSVGDFMRLVMGSKGSMPCDADEVKNALPGIFSRLSDNGDAESCASSTDYDGEAHSIPRAIRGLIENLTSDHSLAEGPAHKRIQLTIIRGKPGFGPEKIASLRAKKASVASKSAELMAREYATYQLAFAAKNDDFANSLAIFRNYL